MIKAVPINAKGEPIGPAQTFSDAQFQKMKRTFVKNFAWKEIENVSHGKSIELIPGAVSTKEAVSIEKEMIKKPDNKSKNQKKK